MHLWRVKIIPSFWQVPSSFSASLMISIGELNAIIRCGFLFSFKHWYNYMIKAFQTQWKTESIVPCWGLHKKFYCKHNICFHQWNCHQFSVEQVLLQLHSFKTLSLEFIKFLSTVSSMIQEVLEITDKNLHIDKKVIMYSNETMISFCFIGWLFYSLSV